jgi:hypothetical protein
VSRVDDTLRERFEALSGPADGDWTEVRRRQRRRTGKVLVAAAALVLGLTAAGLAVGGEAIGIFDAHGKQIPLDSLSPRDQELLVTSMCPHPELRNVRGLSPKAFCREGEPRVEEIANDGSQMHYRIRYPWGLTCVASGPVGGRHDPTFGGSRIATLGCNAGAPGHRLVPTPKRPIPVDASFGSSARNRRVHLLRLSGLAGRGVTSVGLVIRSGPSMKTRVRDNAYSLGSIPDRPWIAIAAYDRTGTEVYRARLFGVGRIAPASRSPLAKRLRHAKSSVWSPGPPKRPDEAPLQHAATPVAVADVYRNGVVELHFASTSSEAYRLLVRSSRASSDTAGVGCRKVAFGGGRWNSLGGGSNAHVGQTMGARLGNSPIGGMPSPPFDVCEISGTYGRYWNDEEGTHELVEVPFTAIGRRYLAERATARDLAYFLRTKKLMAIRRAINRGEPAPSADELARIFGERVVPLPTRNAAAPAGKIGVWTNGRLIVASELTPAGRRLFVTARNVFIGASNIRGLSLTF